MGATPILSDLTELVYKFVDFFLWSLDQLYKGCKGAGNFVFQNFPYDNPARILALFVGFFVLTLFMILLLLVGGGVVAMGLGGVATGSGDQGEGVIIGAGLGVASAESSSSPNSLPSTSYDVDGDGLPNEDDLTPCGSVTCASFPVMCGNGQCQTFVTVAVYAYDDRVTRFCSSPVFFYNIPDYCLKGTLLQTFKLDDVTYSHASCVESLSAVLNPRCVVVNNSVFYSENHANCPLDCNSTASCFKDYTCVDNPYNCPSGMVCCPSGSAHEGLCMDYGVCDSGGDVDFIGMHNIPVHCPCSSSTDCVNDHGGHACCAGGSVHAGFCYADSMQCG
jgi:hypothetical protein